MELSYTLVAVLQIISISLGVGCSTAAITSFFVAISDGKIDEGERRIMGVLYTLLRIAMVLILITTAVMTVLAYLNVGVDYFNILSIVTWITTAVLFANAFLMTKHLIPSSVGPGVQASAWYTLGIIHALPVFMVATVSLLTFLLWYVVFTAAVVLLVYTLVQRTKKPKPAESKISV